MRHEEPTPSTLPESTRTAGRIWSILRILPVLTRRRFVTPSAGWSLSPAFTTAIRILPRLIRMRRVGPDDSPEVSRGTGYADCDGSERLEAPEVGSENTEADQVGDHSDPAEAIHDSVIPLDSASEQIKKIQERRRRRRRAFPEPPVPTFVMVSPGRYIRAEEPAPSSVATKAEPDEHGAAQRIQDPAQDSTIPAAASVPEVGIAKCEFGSLRPSDVDPAGDTGIEDSLVNTLPSLK